MICTCVHCSGMDGRSGMEPRYRTGTPVPHGNSGTVRDGQPMCGAGVRLCPAHLSSAPRPAIHLQDGKGDPSHLLFMVYVHELTTCALTAVGTGKALVSLCMQIFAVSA